MKKLFGNKINFAFCISSTQVMTIENDIKVMNFSNKKIFKIDKENEILKYPLTYARYLTQDLVLISSKFKKFSVIYSADLLDTVYKMPKENIRKFICYLPTREKKSTKSNSKNK